jgi:hypothetical protein
LKMSFHKNSPYPKELGLALLKHWEGDFLKVFVRPVALHTYSPSLSPSV